MVWIIVVSALVVVEALNAWLTWRANRLRREATASWDRLALEIQRASDARGDVHIALNQAARSTQHKRM